MSEIQSDVSEQLKGIIVYGTQTSFSLEKMRVSSEIKVVEMDPAVTKTVKWCSSFSANRRGGGVNWEEASEVPRTYPIWPGNALKSIRRSYGQKEVSLDYLVSFVELQKTSEWADSAHFVKPSISLMTVDTFRQNLHTDEMVSSCEPEGRRLLV